MVGIPNTLATRQDWLNVFSYVQTKNDPALKKEFRLRLMALSGTRSTRVLKTGVDKPAAEQTPDDYEDVIDPASSFAMSGLTEDDISRLIGELQ